MCWKGYRATGTLIAGGNVKCKITITLESNLIGILKLNVLFPYGLVI